MHFNISELDSDFLYKRAKKEATLIFKKESNRVSKVGKVRTFDDVLKDTCYGHAAEVYLIEKCGFKDDPRPYHDVIDPDGNPVEVKVVVRDDLVDLVRQNCNKAAAEKWRDYARKLMIFVGSRKTGGYCLYNTFIWDKNRFVIEGSNMKEKSDGASADYYKLPESSSQLQDLISSKNMNAQIGEIFRACYRYGQVEHSPMLRDAKKMKFYIEAEIARLEKQGE